MNKRYLWTLLLVIGAAAVAAASVIVIDGEETSPVAETEIVIVERDAWRTSSMADQLEHWAAERDIELFSAAPESVPTGPVFKKGKGKPDPCNDCNETLGVCERISCNPCCYSCDGLPYVICVDY